MASVKENSAIVGLAFFTENDGAFLSAKYTPGVGGQSADLPTVRGAIEIQGFGNAFLEESQMRALIQAIRADAEWEGVLAEKRDATAEVQLSNDELKATLVITSAMAGEPVSRDLISRTLVSAGIVVGIYKKNIRELYEKSLTLPPGKTIADVVAEGTQAVAGRDTWFEPLLTENSEVKPLENEDGFVDYRKFSTIRTTSAGTLLMRRHPATAGTTGQTVTGKVVPAQSGVYREFQLGDGVVIDDRDPDLLISTLAGIPIFDDNNVRIDQVVEVENVDLSTGNIDIEGNLMVTGDILTGMSVRVTGDIRVRGTVEAANLQSSGSIHISGGMIGGSKTGGDEDSHQASVQCGGNFTARFAEHVHMKVNGNIHVQEALAHCHVYCKNQIQVGASGGRGQIVGGNVVSGMLIDAKILGTAAFVATQLEVGYDKELKKTFDDIVENYEKNNHTIVELAKAIHHYSQNPKPDDPELPVRLTQDMEKIKAEQRGLAALKLKHYESITNQYEAKIICRKKAFPGVKILMADLNLELKDERNAGIYTIADQAIYFKTGTGGS